MTDRKKELVVTVGDQTHIRNGGEFVGIVKKVFKDALPQIATVKIFCPHSQIWSTDKMNLAKSGKDDFHIYLWAMPPTADDQGDRASPPAKLWGHLVDCRDLAFVPGNPLNAIRDDASADYDVAELVGNNLFVFHDVSHFGSSTEARIFERILVEAVKKFPHLVPDDPIQSKLRIDFPLIYGDTWRRKLRGFLAVLSPVLRQRYERLNFRWERGLAIAPSDLPVNPGSMNLLVGCVPERLSDWSKPAMILGHRNDESTVARMLGEFVDEESGFVYAGWFGDSLYIPITINESYSDMFRVVFAKLAEDMEPLSEADKEKRRQAAREANQAKFIEACLGQKEKHLARLSDQFAEREKKMAKLRAEFIELVRQIDDDQAQITALRAMNADWREGFLQSWQLIMQNAKVESASVVENTLSVKTKKICCYCQRSGRSYELGRFDIVIDLTGKSSVRMINRDKKVGGNDAPHVHAGSPCLGNAAVPITEALAQLELPAVVEISVAYLETLNDDRGLSSEWREVTS